MCSDEATWRPPVGGCHPRLWAGPSVRRAVRAGDGESWSLSSDLEGAVLCREGRLLCVLKEDGTRANVNWSVAHDEQIKEVPVGRLQTNYVFVSQT